MHKISLISVGKIKTSSFAEACDIYLDRISHQCDFDDRILSAGSAAEEHERILKALEKVAGVIVALDETGKESSSKEFAAFIEKQGDAGTPITFVLGGAYGFDDRIRSKASHVMALSRMTFPHELCKLIFLEQLYRAGEILKGSGYHH